MTIKPVEFKLARSADQIAERLNQLQQDYRAGLLAHNWRIKYTLSWDSYMNECECRQTVVRLKRNPDEVERAYLGLVHIDDLRYAALAESMWLYGIKNYTHVPLPGTNYSTESYK